MSPVASLVFTALSPYVPAGRVSSFTVTPVLSALNAATWAVAVLTVVSALSTRYVMVVAAAAPLEPELEPREPALHADNVSAPTARPTKATRAFLWSDTSLYLLVEGATDVAAGYMGCGVSRRVACGFLPSPWSRGAVVVRAISFGVMTSWTGSVRPAMRSSSRRTTISPILVPDWLMLVKDTSGWAAISVSS